MEHTLVFDCEFLTTEGSPSRFWCGPYDPDPVVAQIGVAKIGLEGDFPLLDTLRLYVVPHDRHGERFALDPFFTKLTGIADETIEQKGVSLKEALERTKDFASGVRPWSWGKGEFNMVAISCYVEGLMPPIPATQFGNACALLRCSPTLDRRILEFSDLCAAPQPWTAGFWSFPTAKGRDAI